MAQLQMAEEDEIRIVMTHELKNISLAFVHDLFVFACFTILICGYERTDNRFNTYIPIIRTG